MTSFRLFSHFLLPKGRDYRATVRRVAGFFLLFLWGWTPRAAAGDLNIIDSFRLEGDMAIVTFAEDPGTYYLLEYSDNLANWGPLDMSLGTPSTLRIALGVTKGYFRAIPYSNFAPLDSDGDGMDDLYELTIVIPSPVPSQSTETPLGGHPPMDSMSAGVLARGGGHFCKNPLRIPTEFGKSRNSRQHYGK